MHKDELRNRLREKIRDCRVHLLTPAVSATREQKPQIVHFAGGVFQPWFYGLRYFANSLRSYGNFRNEAQSRVNIPLPSIILKFPEISERRQEKRQVVHSVIEHIE